MLRRVFLLVAALSFSPSTLAAEIPGTDLPYATYRKQLLSNGWQPIRHCGSPYLETCTGRSMGSARWNHPVQNEKIEILLWPCRHGWCLAPAIDEPED
jgi:hypothetical protein